MKRLISVIALFVIPLLPLHAHSSVVIGGAIDLMYERGMDLSVAAQEYYDFLAFYKKDKFYFGGEYFAQSSSPFTGQQTYSVKRFRRGGFLEFLFQAADWGAINPYISGGLGGYQDVVTTAFMSSTVEDTSRFYTSGFGGLGVKFDYAQPVFIAIEARLIFGENLDPEPALSGRAIFGVSF